MSFFLPDGYGGVKKKKDPSSSKRFNQTGSPHRKDATWTEAYNGVKDVYRTGKMIHNVLRGGGPDKRLNRPKDFQETLEKAKLIKQMEQDANKYHKAKKDIDEYYQQQSEYEASLPKKKGFWKF